MIVSMFDPTRDADDESLAMQLVEHLGEFQGRAVRTIPMFIHAGEWAQVGIEALCQAIRTQQPMPRHLVRAATSRWKDQMGGITARNILAHVPTLDRELVSA